MILNGQKATAFLKNPDPRIIAFLVYGPDDGSVHEWIVQYAKGQGIALNDPFVIVDLSVDDVKADPTRLSDEVSSLSFGGGMKFVRLRSATDSVAGAIESVLADAPDGARLVVDAGTLAKSSKLRKLFEKDPRAAAVPCYADEGRDLQRVIRETLQSAGMDIDSDAISFLLARLGNDRQVTRREIEKLILYKNGKGRVSFNDVEQCMGDNGTISLDAVLYAVTDGAVDTLDHELDRLWQDGHAPVSVVRGLLRHCQRLHLTVGQMAAGASYDRAAAALRPPVFFKYKDAFRRQASQWSLDRLSSVLDLLVEAETQCKTTGLPAETICSRAFLRVAVMARGQSRSQRRRY